MILMTVTSAMTSQAVRLVKFRFQNRAFTSRVDGKWRYRRSPASLSDSAGGLRRTARGYVSGRHVPVALALNGNAPVKFRSNFTSRPLTKFLP